VFGNRFVCLNIQECIASDRDMLETHDPCSRNPFSIETLVPDFIPPELPETFSSPDAVATADRSSRHWTSESAWPAGATRAATLQALTTLQSKVMRRCCAAVPLAIVYNDAVM
jgi:hypothetical protein